MQGARGAAAVELQAELWSSPAETRAGNCQPFTQYSALWHQAGDGHSETRQELKTHTFLPFICEGVKAQGLPCAAPLLGGNQLGLLFRYLVTAP